MMMPGRIAGVVVLGVILCFAATCSRSAKPVPRQQTGTAMQESSAEDLGASKNRIALTVSEAARLLKVDKGTLLDAIAEGRLKAAKIGNDYRISRPDLETFWLAQGGGKLF